MAEQELESMQGIRNQIKQLFDAGCEMKKQGNQIEALKKFDET